MEEGKPMREGQVQESPTIGEYLLGKLQEYNIQHVFGIPGDYVLKFYHLMEQSSIQHIGTTREDAVCRWLINDKFHCRRLC
jgi:hypothetical protein